MPVTVRVGQGFDVHPFSDDPGGALVLGGVVFEGERGLAGHSDADVIAHAVTDALLGAAGLGDIGEHFPDTDPRWPAPTASSCCARPSPPSERRAGSRATSTAPSCSTPRSWRRGAPSCRGACPTRSARR